MRYAIRIVSRLHEYFQLVEKKKEISTKRGLRDITKLSPPAKTLENLRLLSIESQEFSRKNNPQNCAPVPLSSGTIISLVLEKIAPFRKIYFFSLKNRIKLPYRKRGMIKRGRFLEKDCFLSLKKKEKNALHHDYYKLSKR